MEAARAARALEREAKIQQQEEEAKKKADDLSSANKARLEKLRGQNDADDADAEPEVKPMKFMF